MPAHTIPPTDEIIETFDLLGDWEDRFSYVLDLGRKLPDFPDSLRTDERRVHGCQSNVWLELGVDRSAEPRVHLRAVSDAHIVNGLIAILISAYDGRTPDEVLAFDIRALLTRIDLESHLSGTRRNGLQAMVARIRAEAEVALREPEPTPEAGDSPAGDAPGAGAGG